jgi:uncharacterized repeat protein (TIGR04052 family)
MLWSWQDGFKFLRAEVVTVSEPQVRPASMQMAPGMSGRSHANGFPVHIGSTGCAASDGSAAPDKECAHPNRSIVLFEAFDPEHDTVVFDVARLLAGVDLDSQATGASMGCMSFPGSASCAAPMRALGLPFGGAPSGEQTVFAREARR